MSPQRAVQLDLIRAGSSTNLTVEDSAGRRFNSFSVEARLGLGELENAHHMSMDTGALAFAAAGDIQNSIERHQCRTQALRIGVGIREAVEPEERLSQPSTLFECEAAPRAQWRSSKNHREVRLFNIQNCARLIGALRVLLHRIAYRHHPVFGTPPLGTPAANRDAVGKTKIQPGPVGAGLPARDDSADVQAMAPVASRCARRPSER